MLPNVAGISCLPATVGVGSDKLHVVHKGGMAYSGKVLVIDSDSDRAGALADLTEEAGFSAATAPSLADAETSLDEYSDWDVVLCDLQTTPEAWICGDTSFRELDVQVPVMMFSNQPRTAGMMRALRLGATDFFATPVEDPDALFASMERCVRLRGMSRELRRSRETLETTNRELRDTVKVLEQDQQAGRQVQLRMLPSSPLVLGDYLFSHTVIPSLYLSGDFTDYFTVDEHFVVFFMADVSGHGSSSAFATVLLKNLFARKRSDYLRRNEDAILEPMEMLRLANRELLELGVGKFATMVVGVLDRSANTLRYSVAGHLPLPILVCDGGARYLHGEGNAVGMLEGAQYTESLLTLPGTFMLAMFSDGILETLPTRNLIDKEALLLELFSAAADSPAELVSRLGLDHVDTAPDDIAALFVSKRGADV